MSKMFRSLRNANYRLYAAGTLVSNTGTWIQRIAQSWLVLQLTDGSGWAIGITTGLQFLPFLVLAPIGGLLADRFPKYRILQTTQASIGLLAAVLATLDLTGVVRVWHVFVLAFLLGVADSFANPARQSFVVEMVGRSDLANAVALNSASFNGARILGPAIAGLLIALIGTGWVMLLSVFLFGGTIVALARMRKADLHTPEPVERKKGMTREGFAYLRSRPDLLLLLMAVFFVGCFGMNMEMTNALMATETYGKGSGEYGLLGSIMAVGSVAGALLAAQRGTPRMRTVVIGAVVFGVIETTAGLMPTYLSYAVILPILGVASMTMITAANALFQLTVAPEMRGRAVAVYGMVFVGCKPLGSPLIGWIGDVLGARWTLILGGLLSMAGTLLAVAIFGRQRAREAIATRVGRTGRTGWVGAGLSVMPERVLAWKLPGTSRTSSKRPPASPKSPRKGSPPRSRPRRAGRSKTS